MSNIRFHQFIAALQLQVLKPAYQTTYTWNKQELNDSLKRVLDVLYTSCVPPVEDEETEEEVEVNILFLYFKSKATSPDNFVHMFVRPFQQVAC